MLFNIWAPDVEETSFKIFSEIQNEVLSGEADAGVIIHENRFTYHENGLSKIIDLGTFWEELTGYPIPLGCIAVKRNLNDTSKKDINLKLSNSVAFALDKPDLSAGYVNKYAQEMDAKVQKQHINLYVNKFSIDLGERGEKAIIKLLNHGAQMGILPLLHQNEIFIK